MRFIKNDSNTLIESDKSMGDVFIASSKLDEAAFSILDSPNFAAVSEPESVVSQSVYFNTKNIWNQNKKAMKPFIVDNIDYFIWISKIKNGKNKKLVKDLIAMIKLHKYPHEWRRNINARNWYSSFFSKYLQQQLDYMILVLMTKTNSYFILKNSFNLINDISILNNSGTSFINNERLMFTFDVKSLYDSLNLDQCIDVLNCLNNDYLNWNPWIFNFVIDILQYFKNNTFIKYKDQIHQMIDGIGTGFSHSGSLANITLLYFELKNKNKLYRSLKDKSATYEDDDFLQYFKPIECKIICWKRYIDDEVFIIDIDSSIFDTNLKFGKFISLTKKAIKMLYPPNIKLKSKVSKKVVFLNVELSLKPDQSIATKLYEKPLNKHQSLHYQSNNPMVHKRAVFNSQLFRSVCIMMIPEIIFYSELN